MCDRYFQQICEDRKAKTALHGFIGIVNKYKYKPNKLWIDQGRNFTIVLRKNGYTKHGKHKTCYVSKKSRIKIRPR